MRILSHKTWEKEKCFSSMLLGLVIGRAEEQVTMSLPFCDRKYILSFQEQQGMDDLLLVLRGLLRTWFNPVVR